jgi:hypothetical protein
MHVRTYLRPKCPCASAERARERAKERKGERKRERNIERESARERERARERARERERESARERERESARARERAQACESEREGKRKSTDTDGSFIMQHVSHTFRTCWSTEDMPQQAWACASARARARGAPDTPIPQALASAMDPGASFALAAKEDPYASTAQGPACMKDPSQDQLGFWPQSERASEQGRQGQRDGEQCMCAC